MTFFAIDVGNSRLKWALYESMDAGARLLSQGAVFLEHIDRLAEFEWNRLAAPRRVLGCAVAAEAVRHRVEAQIEQWDVAPSWVVPSHQEAGLINGYDHPSRLGADRWVAMIGARDRMLRQCQAQGEAPKPLVVVMVGTAVTVEAVDVDGHFLGGLILPGHGIMLRALVSATAGLHVPTGEVTTFPTNTSDALTSGGTFAVAGAINHLYQRLSEHCQQAPICYMTGGAGWKMAPSMTVPYELVESLIFEGLLTLARHRWSQDAR